MLWYQGQLDWVDGVYSNEAWLNALEWSRRTEFVQTNRDPKEWGYVKRTGPLTEAMILDAGHLALKEKPEAVLDLFRESFGPTIDKAESPEVMFRIV